MKFKRLGTHRQPKSCRPENKPNGDDTGSKLNHFSVITADEFEAHVLGLFNGARIFTSEQVASIEGVSVRTVWNASSAGDLVGDGRGKDRRYKLWDIYQWHLNRRKPTAAKQQGRPRKKRSVA